MVTLVHVINSNLHEQVHIAGPLPSNELTLGAVDLRWACTAFGLTYYLRKSYLFWKYCKITANYLKFYCVKVFWIRKLNKSTTCRLIITLAT